jgi:hypothetical protein
MFVSLDAPTGTAYGSDLQCRLPVCFHFSANKGLCHAWKIAIEIELKHCPQFRKCTVVNLVALWFHRSTASQ